MSSIFSVPGPIKSLFEQFPLTTYRPISKQDDCMSKEIMSRKFAFQGPNAVQQTPNSTFTLGVYNVFTDPETNCVLATDPSCLYAEFALCKKSLGLPEANYSSDIKGYQHTIGLLSHQASARETLPILIEGFNERHIRSSEGIDEVLRSRVLDDPEQLMYITMLDHVVYDCWITQVIYHTTEDQFLRLYSYGSEERSGVLNRLAISGMKSALVKRNEFHLRHKELVRNIESPLNVYKARSLDQLLQPIFKKCKETLLQFQEILGEKPFVSTGDGTPTYLELKVASYVLCISNLDDSVPLKAFLEEQCPHLLTLSRATLSQLQQANSTQ